MAGDVRGHVRRTVAGHRVIAARDHHELRSREECRQVFPDRDRADRVRVAPHEQRRRRDRPQPLRQIDPRLEDPRRRGREVAPVVGPPVGRAEAADVHTARGRDEHETPDAIGARERREDGDDAAHRLRDEIHPGVHLLERETDEVVETADVVTGRLMAETRPREPHGLDAGKLVDERRPERRVAAGAGKEERHTPVMRIPEFLIL